MPKAEYVDTSESSSDEQSEESEESDNDTRTCPMNEDTRYSAEDILMAESVRRTLISMNEAGLDVPTYLEKKSLGCIELPVVQVLVKTL